MATLLPYCLGKVKKEGKRGGDFHSDSYRCIIHPLSPRACRMRVDALSDVCAHVSMFVLVWVPVIGSGMRVEWGETGAIITPNGVIHPATTCLYINVLLELGEQSVSQQTGGFL